MFANSDYAMAQKVCALRERLGQSGIVQLRAYAASKGLDGANSVVDTALRSLCSSDEHAPLVSNPDPEKLMATLMGLIDNQANQVNTPEGWRGR
jgi:hypothetical protein